MHSIIFCAIGLLIAVTGVVSVERESVSVYDGDSVTLLTDTKIQRDETIDWRFGDQQDLIARIRATSLKIYDDVLDGRFTDRLKLNTETGDLTITDITTQHTGDYKLEINSRISTTKTFNINVSGDKVKTEMIGDSVILFNNVIKNPGDEKMMWRIQHKNSPFAEIIRNGITYKVYDGRFSGRLQVDDQTGDLIITNIRPEDFGSYEVDITVGSIYTIHRSFSVNVKGPGLSPGAVAGISVVTLLLITAVAFYFHRKISKTIKLDEKMTVVAGQRAVLQAGLKELKEGDEIEWRFGQDTEMKDAVIMWPWRSPGTLIAKRDEGGPDTYNGPDERFKYKLSLDRNTGDLIINDVSNKHFGVYQLKITSSGKTSYKRLKVFVTEKMEPDSVFEGASVTSSRGKDLVRKRGNSEELEIQLFLL